MHASALEPSKLSEKSGKLHVTYRKKHGRIPAQTRHQTPPLPFEPWGRVVGGGGVLGVRLGLGAVRGRGGGVGGTPTYITQNDPVVAPIILNTYAWGF